MWKVWKVFLVRQRSVLKSLHVSWICCSRCRHPVNLYSFLGLVTNTWFIELLLPPNTKQIGAYSVQWQPLAWHEVLLAHVLRPLCELLLELQTWNRDDIMETSAQSSGSTRSVRSGSHFMLIIHLWHQAVEEMTTVQVALLGSFKETWSFSRSCCF